MYLSNPYHGFTSPAPTACSQGRMGMAVTQGSLPARHLSHFAHPPHEVHEGRAAVIGYYLLDRSCP